MKQSENDLHTAIFGNLQTLCFRLTHIASFINIQAWRFDQK